MVFSDLFFILVFLPLFIITYLLCAFIDTKRKRIGLTPSFCARNVNIIIFSLIFYAWGEPLYVILLICSSFVNYIFGLLFEVQRDRRHYVFITGITFNILVLGIFKYSDFVVTQLNTIGCKIPEPNIRLPIGISFYTFQAISYLFDVYRNETKPQRSFKNLLLYISMFPQLIAGPIVRYGHVCKEISSRKTSYKDIYYGSYRFLIGLGKKVIFANIFYEIVTVCFVERFDSITTCGAWIGLFAFTLQIYYDFSGYSDMAIGIGRCLGFHFNENFYYPYCCNSVTDFWRRWHISLGSFFRDYVYIPLGGNKKNKMFNILIVWFLTGVWHGASWNYILWGLYFGIIVVTEKYTILKVYKYLPSSIIHVYSMAMVVLGWGIFYFEDLHKMKLFFYALFGNSLLFNDYVTSNLISKYFGIWFIAVVFCMPISRLFHSYALKLIGYKGMSSMIIAIRTIISICILFICVSLLIGATNNAFIYTRF